jgi:hypothetical protein
MCVFDGFYVISMQLLNVCNAMYFLCSFSAIVLRFRELAMERKVKKMKIKNLMWRFFIEQMLFPWHLFCDMGIFVYFCKRFLLVIFYAENAIVYDKIL